MTRKFRVGRRLIFNLFLVAGVIALCALLWIDRPAPASTPQSVSTVAVNQIAHITVRTRVNVLEFARAASSAAANQLSNDSWLMRAPRKTRADTQRIDALLELAAATPTHRYARDAIDDTTTGLADPDLAVRFNNEAPITLGGAGPTPGTRYVATAHALLLVPVQYPEDQSAGWTHWIAPSVIAPDAHLDSLVLPRLTLTRSDTGGWQVAPKSADRGADYAQATVDAWRYGQALSVEPSTTSRERIACITLRFADAPTRHLDVIAREPDLILRDTALGADYHFAANQAAPMLDMHHPDLLRQSRGDELQPSTIPLVATPELSREANTSAKVKVNEHK